jgi:hypothetical protein
MKTIVTTLTLLGLLSTTSYAADHPCAADARLRALGLLKLHHLLETRDGKVDFQAMASTPDNQMMIDDKVETLAPVKALKGKGKFDVLETTGYIYKATYRQRMIYAQIPDSCVLIGQEIIEVVDPY